MGVGLLLARKGTTDRVNLSLPDKNQQEIGRAHV